LLLLLFIWKTIIILKRLIFYIFFRAISVSTMSKSRANIIIFATLILWTLFIFCFSLIYGISFIFLINCRIKNVYLTFLLLFTCFVNNESFVIVAYILVVCISFLIFSTFFIRLIVFSNLFSIEIKLIRSFFARISLRRCVNFSIKRYYLVNVVIEIILNTFLFLDL